MSTSTSKMYGLVAIAALVTLVGAVAPAYAGANGVAEAGVGVALPVADGGYRKDYAAADFRMLSCLDPSGAPVARQIVLYALALLPVSLLPTVAGMTGPFYFLGALALGLGFCALSLSGLKDIQARARMIFRASLLHLSLLLILMVLDKA